MDLTLGECIGMSDVGSLCRKLATWCTVERTPKFRTSWLSYHTRGDTNRDSWLVSFEDWDDSVIETVLRECNCPRCKILAHMAFIELEIAVSTGLVIYSIESGE